MESLLETITQLDMTYIYIAVFAIAYIENLFPPFPSDVIVVFCGSLVAMGKGDVILTLASSTLGSTLGFLSMYWIGDQFGDRILEKGKIKFIPVESVHKVEAWFNKYGYWIVIANRFMAGTRAVVSFFAGMSEMNLLRTTLLSACSALAWNIILVYLGYLLGENWRSIGSYLKTYSTIATIVTALIVIGFVVRFYLQKRKTNNSKQ